MIVSFMLRIRFNMEGLKAPDSKFSSPSLVSQLLETAEIFKINILQNPTSLAACKHIPVWPSSGTLQGRECIAEVLACTPNEALTRLALSEKDLLESYACILK